MTAPAHFRLPNDADLHRIAEQVEGPDHVFHLGDVERAVMREFSLGLKEARRIVNNWDRRAQKRHLKHFREART
jgi:hypothetical protein